MQKINWGTLTHTAELILEGDYRDDQLNEVTNDFVQYMQYKTEIDKIPDVLIIAEWRGKLKCGKNLPQHHHSIFI